MAELILIGSGTKTHLRADGTGIVPAGRARCEITNDGKVWLYKDANGTISPARPAPAGDATCHWCRNRTVLG